MQRKLQVGLLCRISHCAMRFGLLLGLMVPAFLCRSPDLAQLLNDRILSPMADSREIDVLFATNRKILATESGCSNRRFLSKIGTSMQYGLCTIHVPRNHSVGELPRSDTGMRTARPPSDTNFSLREYQPLHRDAFSSRLKSSNAKEALVFVHGFNVSFEEAALRSAQIAYDVKFQGQVVLFTWPAGSGRGILDKILINRTYALNRDAARRSVGVLAAFLKLLASSGVKPHLIVHSMGHQIALPALITLHREGHRNILKELVLNAPDFPAVAFKKMAPALLQTSRRITLYCSPGDRALQASDVQSSKKRIGQCERVPGVDVINVNELSDAMLGLGHGYYARRAILTDVYQVLLGIEAKRRLFIRNSHARGGEKFVLRK